MQVFAHGVGGESAAAALAYGIKYGHLKHGLVIGELQQQFIHLLEHLFTTCILTVDLVDDDNRFEIEPERFLQHETSLRKRAFGGIDEQYHAIDHRQPTFHLAAEISVSGRVDNVDLHTLP